MSFIEDFGEYYDKDFYNKVGNMKTFNTMEELYEALKPFEPDDAEYVYLYKNNISFFTVDLKYICEIKIIHNIIIDGFEYRKIPRPVDLTKYIGKVVRIKHIDKSELYVILHSRYLHDEDIVSIELLTSEDICSANE